MYHRLLGILTDWKHFSTESAVITLQTKLKVKNDLTGFILGLIFPSQNLQYYGHFYALLYPLYVQKHNITHGDVGNTEI